MSFVRTPMLPRGHALDIFRMSGALGDAVEFESFRDMKTADHAEVRVYVEGTVRVTRLTGEQVGPGVFERLAGDVSTDGIQVADMPAGRFRFEVVTEKASYYCMRHRQNKRLDVQTMRLRAGQRFKVKKGERVFLAMGECTQGPAPMMLEATDDDSPYITARTNLLGLRLTW